MSMTKPLHAFNALVTEYGFTKALTGIGAGVVTGLTTTLIVYNVMPSCPKITTASTSNEESTTKTNKKSNKKENV